MTKQFAKELCDLLNKHCIENICNMPDYIIADHLIKTLENLGRTSQLTSKFFNRQETFIVNPEWAKAKYEFLTVDFTPINVGPPPKKL